MIGTKKTKLFLATVPSGSALREFTMSDFMPRDLLPDLWEEILQRHWNYLDTEEGMQKLEERKKLEACFKEFLSIVPHDRKFFLPETAHVLKKSIKEMDDFSAYKAMMGFESISQYANNLFTKPWRKEYRYIKMYSGFYAHDIGANLVDADKLFEAMGYKILPDQTLMLDGPICPDQVTNVSRDAMAAYVECQIMKQIFLGLTASELSCSWQDIFNFRETHIGGASQAIRAMTYAIHERRYKKEKLNADNCYGAGIQQSQPQPQMIPSCGLCAHSCHATSQMPPVASACNHHPMQPQQPAAQSTTQYPGMCSIHSQPTQNIYMQNAVMGAPPPVPLHYKAPGYVPPQMSHSKSLEHYGEHVNTTAGGLPHRHSFDQPYDNGGRPPYDGVYDCVDGYQSCNFSAYNHPYNRYPLPYNISSQLNNHFPSQCAAAMNNVNQYAPPPPPPPTAVVVPCNHKVAMPEQPNFYGKLQPDQVYGDCNGYLKKAQDVYNNHGSGNVKDNAHSRQYTYGSNGRSNEQLIDLDDRPQNELQYNRNLNNFDNYDHPPNGRGYKVKQAQQNYDVSRAPMNNHTSKDLYNRNYEELDDIPTNNATYGVSDRKSAMKKPSDRYARNAEILQQYEKAIDNNDLSRSRDYDNYQDTVDTGGRIVNGANSEISRSHNKDHDGVGSFETWDYVFQNLEKHGYSKDLGDRGDLLMRGLDLDSMNIGSASEKRRSRNMDSQKRSVANDSSTSAAMKSKTLEKADLAKDIVNLKPKVLEKSILKHDNDLVVQKAAVTKSTQVQKPTPAMSTPAMQKLKNTKSSNTTIEVNGRQSLTSNTAITTAIGGSGAGVANTRRQSSNHRSSGSGSVPNTSSGGVAKVENNQQQTSNSASNIVTNSSEWSCRFCTFLNPDTKRICEMCCRSRDFISDASNAPTCV